MINDLVGGNVMRNLSALFLITVYFKLNILQKKVKLTIKT
jgi:hypothetical protein